MVAAVATADVSPGLLSDFESGTNEGWGGGALPTHVPTGGPLGANDGFLQIGGGNNLATFNTGLSGNLDSSIGAIEVDLRRPAGESDLEMRLVLFGPGSGSFASQWTSTDFLVVPGDGAWNTYSFSVREADLTKVVGGPVAYSELLTDLDRIMFRYDPGEPNSRGLQAAGTLGLDNITAVAPVPGDYNGDGSVGPEDYSAWQSSYGSTVASGEGADGNGDGLIDAADYTIWRDAVGSAATAVPEPVSCCTTLLAACLAFNRARRR